MFSTSCESELVVKVADVMCSPTQVWLPGNMAWDGQALQHRDALPLPANCGLTAAAAGTIRREGIVQVPTAVASVWEAKRPAAVRCPDSALQISGLHR